MTRTTESKKQTSPLFQPTLEPFDLHQVDGWPAQRHQFEQESIWAIQAALATGRPLLVRGEPGTGKSQLARAAAQVMGRPFLYQVITSRTEVTDLLYEMDDVRRLAEAQVMGPGCKNNENTTAGTRPGALHQPGKNLVGDRTGRVPKNRPSFRDRSSCLLRKKSGPRAACC